jgi:hypothetical protein
MFGRIIDYVVEIEEMSPSRPPMQIPIRNKLLETIFLTSHKEAESVFRKFLKAFVEATSNPDRSLITLVAFSSSIGTIIDCYMNKVALQKAYNCG